MRVAALALVAAVIACASLGTTAERWPAVAVERWPDLRLTEGGTQEVVWLVVFHTTDRQLVLSVDYASYDRLPPGTKVTLLVNVNRGRIVKGNTMVLFGDALPAPSEGTDT